MRLSDLLQTNVWQSVSPTKRMALTVTITFSLPTPEVLPVSSELGCRRHERNSPWLIGLAVTGEGPRLRKSTISLKNHLDKDILLSFSGFNCTIPSLHEHRYHKYMKGKIKSCLTILTIRSETLGILGYSLLVFSLYTCMYINDMAEVNSTSVFYLPFTRVLDRENFPMWLSILWKRHFDGCIMFSSHGHTINYLSSLLSWAFGLSPVFKLLKINFWWTVVYINLFFPGHFKK